MINTKKLLLIVVLGNVFSQAAFGMLILKPMNRSLQQSRLIVKKNNKKRDINSNTYIAGDWVGGDKSNGDVHKIVIDGKNLDDKNDFTLYTHTDGDFIKKQILYSYFTQLFTGSKKKRSEEIISFVGGHNIQTGAFGYVNTGYSNDSWLFSLMAAPFRAIGWTCKQAKRGTLSTYYWYKNSG